MHDGAFKEQPIVKCVSCDRFFTSGRWSERIEPFLTSLLAAPVRILEVEPQGALEKRMPKRIHFLLGIEDHEVELDLPTKNTQCPDCTKKNSHYFEGELQLRGATSEQIEIAKAMLVSHRGHVKSEAKRKDGVDLKVSSNKAILATIKDLTSRYIGVSHVTSTLHTRDHLSSKEKYRVTALFRYFALAKGDVVLHEDEPFIIEKTKEKFCELRSLKDDRTTVSVDLEALEDYRKIEPFTTSVVTTRPALSILTESYVDTPAQNRSGSELEPGDTVRAIAHEGFYAVIEKTDSSTE